LAIYLGGVVVISAVAATVAPLVSPVALGAGLLVALSAFGILVVAARQRSTDTHPVKNLQRELNHSRREYKRLFTAIPSFICVLDRDHRIVEANSLYREEFGATDRSLCYEVCKHRTTQCPDCIVDRTFATGRTHSAEETLIKRDGRRINAVVHTRPVFDDEGDISGVMEVFTDITEVKKLQRQLTLMGRAVAGMAHRIKNILMGLEGGIFVVNTGLETDDRESISEGWQMVERNVDRVSQIVQDLLYCSKDRTPEFEPDVCPHDIVTEVRDLFSGRTDENSIELRTELGEPPHRGAFDPEGIHSLLCNLVANAIDACRFDPSEEKDGHTITMRCHRDEHGATVLEVEDDGAGIPADFNNRVFEDFFSSKGSEGTGIGLLVVQKVAEEHGGSVAFTSTPGGGSTFTVTLPSAPA
jgi:PAS domain S-box-containing protein